MNQSYLANYSESVDIKHMQFKLRPQATTSCHWLNFEKIRLSVAIVYLFILPVLFKVCDLPPALVRSYKCFKKKPHLKTLKRQQHFTSNMERSVHLTGPIEKLLSNEHKGYACFYIPDKGLQIGSYKTVLFLPHDKIMHLLNRKTLP